MNIKSILTTAQNIRLIKHQKVNSVLNAFVR